MKLTMVGLTTVPALIGLVLVLTALGPAQPALSPDTRVAQPAKNVPPEVASLAGVWEGSRGQVFPSRLVVEKIHPEWASILYAWQDDPNGRFRAGWVRTWAKILPGGKLHWRRPGNFTFELSDDCTALVGKKDQAGRTITIVLHRSAPLLASVNTDRLPLPGSPE
jgi:hypothetical protein